MSLCYRYTLQSDIILSPKFTCVFITRLQIAVKGDNGQKRLLDAMEKWLDGKQARRNRTRMNKTRRRCVAHQKTIWLWFNASWMAYLQRTTLPNTSPHFPLSCYSSFSPALIFLSLQSCFNQNNIFEKKKKNEKKERKKKKPCKQISHIKTKKDKLSARKPFQVF